MRGSKNTDSIKFVKELNVPCDCVQKCAIIRLEYFEDVNEAWLGLYPKRGHKSHGVIVTKEKAKEVIEFLTNHFNLGDASNA